MKIRRKLKYLETVTTKELSEIIKKPFRFDSCFLCKRRITKKNNSKEHVLPRWLLEYMKINGSNDRFNVGKSNQSVRYSANKISCCLDCNSLLSIKIELSMAREIKKGYKNINYKYHNSVSFRKRFSAWTNLVYLKFFFSDLGRRKNLSKKHSRKLITPQELKDNCQLLYLFILNYLIPNKIKFLTDDFLSIQSHLSRQNISLGQDNVTEYVRKMFNPVSNCFPHYSNIFFECKKAKDSSLNFNFQTEPSGYLLLQINDLGIITNVKDYGFLENGLSPRLNVLRDIIDNRPIVGIQLTEVLTQVFLELKKFYYIKGQFLIVFTIKGPLMVIQKRPQINLEREGKISARDLGIYQKYIHIYSQSIQEMPLGQYKMIICDDKDGFLDLDPDKV